MTDSYISIDLETTGLNPKWDRIIEIGALKVQKGQITDRFSTFVNPGRKLEAHITELTGIRDEDLADAPYMEDVLEDMLVFLEDLPFLGHSVLFDYSFLKKVATDRKIEFEKNGIDTLKIARKYLADLEHRNLDYLCKYYKIPHHAHRALEDAEATLLLFQKLGELFGDKDEGVLFAPTPLIFKIKRDIPATKAQKEQLFHMLRQRKIVINVDVERMTRREASRFIDRIRSGYFVAQNGVDASSASGDI